MSTREDLVVNKRHLSSLSQSLVSFEKLDNETLAMR